MTTGLVKGFARLDSAQAQVIHALRTEDKTWCQRPRHREVKSLVPCGDPGPEGGICGECYIKLRRARTTLAELGVQS